MGTRVRQTRARLVFDATSARAAGHDHAERDRSMTADTATRDAREAAAPGPVSATAGAACRALRHMVERAQNQYMVQYGVSTRDPQHLVAVGLLREMPHCPDGGAIILASLSPSTLSVTCSEH
jgi:hypothetical protein